MLCSEWVYTLSNLCLGKGVLRGCLYIVLTFSYFQRNKKQFWDLFPDRVENSVPVSSDDFALGNLPDVGIPRVSMKYLVITNPLWSNLALALTILSTTTKINRNLSLFWTVIKLKLWITVTVYTTFLKLT